MTSILNVPYVGQVGVGANEHGNDCGPTSAAMVIGYFGLTVPTVDSLFNEVVPSGDYYTSFGDISRLLDNRGISPNYDANVSTKDLFWILAGGVPAIALIRYGALSTIRPNKFAGSHFIVVIGMDLDTVYINDPLNTPTTGEHVAVPMAMFETAWSTVGDGNPQRSLIYPNKKLGVVIETPPIKTVYPRDSNGCNVRKIPGDLSDSNKLRAIKYGTAMNIYIERDGWGKISSTKEEWVCMEYTK